MSKPCDEIADTLAAIVRAGVVTNETFAKAQAALAHLTDHDRHAGSHVAVLERRRTHLARRIRAAEDEGKDLSYDKQEFWALTWAVAR